MVRGADTSVNVLLPEVWVNEESTNSLVSPRRACPAGYVNSSDGPRSDRKWKGESERLESVVGELPAPRFREMNCLGPT